MEKSQGIEDEDKEGVARWATMGVQQAFNVGGISFQEDYIDIVLAKIKASRGNFCC